MQQKFKAVVTKLVKFGTVSNDSFIAIL